jgi:hypothetical protein
MFRGSAWAAHRDCELASMDDSHRRLAEWEEKRARCHTEFAARILIMAAEVSAKVKVAVTTKVTAVVTTVLDSTFVRHHEALRGDPPAASERRPCVPPSSYRPPSAGRCPLAPPQAGTDHHKPPQAGADRDPLARSSPTMIGVLSPRPRPDPVVFVFDPVCFSIFVLDPVV